MTRKVNELTLQTLEECEGYKPEAYLDQAGVPTIGYGHTKGVQIGDSCTQQQAQDWLDEDLTIAENAVTQFVKVPLTDNQFGALVMFTFNEGVGSLEHSTLLKVLNAGDYNGVPAQLKLWNKYRDPKTGNLVTCLGLVRRRASEIQLWSK